jgi:hypothetical protein
MVRLAQLTNTSQADAIRTSGLHAAEGSEVRYFYLLAAALASRHPSRKPVCIAATSDSEIEGMI